MDNCVNKTIENRGKKVADKVNFKYNLSNNVIEVKYAKFGRFEKDD